MIAIVPTCTIVVPLLTKYCESDILVVREFIDWRPLNLTEEIIYSRHALTHVFLLRVADRTSEEGQLI